MGDEKEDALNLRTWLTPGNIGTLVMVIGALITSAVWIDNRYITADEMKAMETRITARSQQRESAIMRKLAWSAVTDAKRDAIVARNRVNECNIKRDKREPFTALERAVCTQYEDDLHNAQVAFEAAQQLAKSTSSKGDMNE